MSREPEQKAPGLTLNRLGVARLSSGVGAIGLIIGISSLLFAGNLSGLTFVGVLVGIIGFSIWMMLAPTDLKDMLSGRRTVYSANSLLVSALFAGIIVFVYTLAVAASVGVDLTSVGYYSLQSDVRPVIKSLTQPIQITAFYTRQMLGTQSADAPVLKAFVDAAPTLVKLVFVDPDAEPLTAKSFNFSGQYGVYVSYLGADGKPDTRSNYTVKMRTGSVQQTAVADAILQLTVRGKFRILFTTGSGEINIDTIATGIRNGVQNVGIDIGTIDLSAQDIPEGTTLLVILSPFREFTQLMVDKIKDYTARGGKLLVMANPAYRGDIQFMMTDNSPMAAYLWDTWGVRPQRDLVFDPTSFSGSKYYVRPPVANRSLSIIYKDRVGDETSVILPLFRLSQSWEIRAKESLPTGVTVSILYQTSNDAFGKTNLVKAAAQAENATRETNDLGGPLTLALTAENSVNNSRLVAVGDASWVTDDNIVEFDGSLLWTNMVDWLTKYIEQVTVQPVFAQPPLNVTTTDLDVVSFITMVFLPGAVLLAGAIVWWRRVRR